MRIVLENKDKVIALFLENTKLTKKELALKLNVSYWTLRNWLRDLTIPEEMFNSMNVLCPAITEIAVYEKIPDTWGASKGGKKSFQRRNRKQTTKLIKLMLKSQRKQINLPQKLDSEFYELFGILMGDGCISKYFSKTDNRYRHCTIITGHSINDYDYYNSHVTNLFANLFGIKKPSIYKRKNAKCIQMTVGHKVIAEFFLKHGFPLGLKGNLKIPDRMIQENEYTNKIIRGLFDTDGCFAARKDENYKYPYIMICTSSDVLRNQLKELLRARGFPAYFHENNVVVRGIKNTNKWFSEIGSSHPLKLKRYKEWKQTGRLLPIGLVDQRYDIKSR